MRVFKIYICTAIPIHCIDVDIFDGEADRKNDNHRGIRGFIYEISFRQQSRCNSYYKTCTQASSRHNIRGEFVEASPRPPKYNDGDPQKSLEHRCFLQHARKSAEYRPIRSKRQRSTGLKEEPASNIVLAIISIPNSLGHGLMTGTHMRRAEPTVSYWINRHT